MNTVVRRLSVCAVLGGALLVAALGDGSTARAQGCDPNYASTSAGCVPGDRDYDCPELHAMGLGDIPVVGTDWQHLDGYYNYNGSYWESYPDGLACEWYGE